MISEFVEIILKIYQALNKNSTPEKAVEDINQKNHYNRKIVAAAYSWICDKIIRDVLNRKSSGDDSLGIRMPAEYEIGLLGQENINYLRHFYNIGVINNADLESLLNQIISMPEGTVSKATIDALIFSLFLDMDNYVLPGSRLLLISSDKIN